MNVTVVGAGIIGCAVAFELASRGARVRIIDRRPPGGGATQASAGILAPHIEAHTGPLLTLTLAGLDAYDPFIARLRQASPAPLEYERRGTLQAALTDDEREELMAAAARLSAAGVRHELLDGPASRQREPAISPHVDAALHIPAHGYVSVEGFMSTLLDAAVRLGATVDRGEVSRIEPRTADTAVIVGDDVVESDAVVVAAGSWSSDLTGRLITPAPVKPIRGQLLHLRTRDRIAGQVLWGGRVYLVPRADGLVLAGATVEDAGFSETSTVSGVRGLLDAAVELVPALEEAALEDVRVGLRPLATDELPVIGPSSTAPGVFYATGHYRNGVLLAPLTAMLMADLMFDGGRRPELRLTEPARLGL